MSNESNNQLTMNEMMNEIDNSMKRINNGDVLKGKVISVTDEEILVNIGYIPDGIIPKEEISFEKDINPKELVNPEDEINVYVLKLNDGEGNVLLSKKRADKIKAWDELEEHKNNNDTISVEVKEEVKGGLITYIKGVRGFIPASQISINYIESLKDFIGKTLQVKVIEIDKTKNKLVLSSKIIEQEKLEAKKEKLLNNIKKGERRKGTVVRLTKFGAFVDLGGVDGLIHISDLSWQRVNHPSEVVNVGDEVEVYVLDFDKEKERIALGLKDITKNPWNDVLDKYKIGSIIEGKVVKLLDFGAFVEVEPGVEGLVHISQISDERIKNPKDVLKVGDKVKVKVLGIDKDNLKISLSIKEAQDKEVEEIDLSYQSEDEPVTLGDLFKDKLKDLF